MFWSLSPSEKCDLLKNKLKHICFSTLNSYNFDKINSNLTESKSKSFTEIIQRKILVIQKLTKATLQSSLSAKFI